MGNEEQEPRGPLLSFIDSAHDLLTNTRTALLLIGLVSAASLIGTLLPQHPGGLEGLRSQGMEEGSAFLDALGLYDLYSSTWFVLLLGLLMASVLLCTNQRLGRFLRAKRKRLPRAASLVAHYSLLVVMAGAAWGGLSGLHDTLYLAEGETAQVPGADFAVRLDRAEERYNPDGSVRDWYSYVTVVEDGQDVREFVIEVNRPLQHKGFGLYQSEFGQMPDSTGPLPMSPLRLSVTESGIPVQLMSMFDTSSTGEALDLPFTSTVPNSTKRIEVIILPGRDLQLWMSRVPTLPDKVVLQVLEGDTVGMGEDAELLFGEEIDTTATVSVGSIEISLEDLDPELGMDMIPQAFEQPQYWSGLQVGKNPGLPLIWIGFVGMGLGWTVAFMLPLFRRTSGAEVSE